MRHAVHQPGARRWKIPSRDVLAERHGFARAGIPATEPRSAPAMISMALRCSASVKAQAPRVRYPFDSVRQGVHAGGRLQRWRHGVHHIGIDKGHLRDIMRIVTQTNLRRCSSLGDDIVNRHSAAVPAVVGTAKIGTLG
ncbi:hypothetical protein LNP25_02285 [Klebsiella variicola subsp. variicola]|nr:hypothetical protein [Klebsiella variicola subsp. variicola]